ncbi:MAG: helix-turn-helix transcriptional regulator [Minicystis sp.]
MDDARFGDLLTYIAANMRRIRQARDMTQEALAERADLSLRSVQEIETGRVNIRVTVLAAIAEALDVSPTALLKPAKLPDVVRGRPRKKPTK